MNATAHESAQDRVQPELRQRTVLVVDDEESIRQLIAVMLELEGLRVLQARDGEQALEIAQAENLDLVTLDVMMPGLTGWEVADAMDADPRLSVVPRLMVSGVPIVELRRQPGAARAGAVLAKPFDFVEFTEAVQKLLAQPSAVPEPRTSAHEL